MPTVLSNFNAGTGEIKLRYQEPYVTEGLNAKFVGIVPRGIHRGFRLATNALALSVTVVADSTTSDHVANYVTQDGHCLTLKRTGGDFVLTLGASSTLIIVLYGTYTVGATTAADIRSYTLTEWNALTDAQRAEYVVLGTVVTPGSGTISADNITHARRSWAWENIGQDAAAWPACFDDPSFENFLTGPLPSNVPWQISNDANSSFSITNTDPTGQNQLTYTQVTGAASSNSNVGQTVSIPVRPGQTVRARLLLKNLQVATSGTLSVSAFFANQAGASVGTVSTAIDATTIDSSYRVVDTTFQAPTGAAFLTWVRVVGSSLTYPAAADGYRLDDFQVWVERLGYNNSGAGSTTNTRAPLVSKVRMVDPHHAHPNIADLVMSMFNGVVTATRYDGTEDASHIPPVMDWRGKMQFGAGLADQTTPRVLANVQPATSNRTLVLGTKHATAGVAETRLYVTDFGNFEITLNAVWDPNLLTWSQDNVGRASTKFTIECSSTTGGFISNRVAAGTGPWADSVWLTSGELSFTSAIASGVSLFVGPVGLTGSTGSVTVTGDTTDGDPGGPRISILTSNPGYAVAATANTLYSKNIPKAWITTSWNGSTYVVQDGFNLTLSGAVGGAHNQTFTFGSPMVNGQYAVIVTVQDPTGHASQPPLVTTALQFPTQFDLFFYNTSYAAMNNSYGNNAVNVVVFGEQ